MSLTDLLFQIFVRPLFVIYATLLEWIQRQGIESGWDLICFGILLNLILLPLYNQMERVGRADALNRGAMDAEIARIKNHYKGRERYFYIRTIYRVCGHRPFSVVFRAGDLYLQVIVFATVYHFLSSNQDLMGASFLAIDDLARPDRLLGGINLLPLVMTALNVVSAIFYDRDSVKRRNAFLLAAVFLVLLYSSPSGLVLYWTANNAFSLLRNLFWRMFSGFIPGGWCQFMSRWREQE